MSGGLREWNACYPTPVLSPQGAGRPAGAIAFHGPRVVAASGQCAIDACVQQA
ncbi:hypothetical protein [Devosia sp. DBB001]|nr:hypothetical protein [Devosia sp. DBB001]